MNVVSLVILLVSAGHGVLLGGAGVVAPLDTAVVRVMAEGVIVLVIVLLGVVVCHPEVEATADRHPIEDEMRCHMPTEMVPRRDSGAGAEFWAIISTFEYMLKFLYCVIVHGFIYGYYEAGDTLSFLSWS